jgi:hypothetical protein
MSKYNVGDKVKVREDLVADKIYGRQISVDSMVELKGREVTIKSVYNGEEYGIEGMGYTWTNEMFEVKPDFKYGDRVELISIDGYDKVFGLRRGDRGIIISTAEYADACRISFPRRTKGIVIYYNQIKLIEPDTTTEPTQSVPNKGTIKYRITDDGITYTTLNGSKTGKSIKSGKDEADNKIGILIATARALGFNEDKISDIVDILFDDDSYDSKAKCENAVMKNDIARALSILDKYKE